MVEAGRDAGPEARAAEQALVEAHAVRAMERTRDWLRRAGDEPAEWYDAALLTDTLLLLTAEELAEVNQAVLTMLRPYRARRRQADPPAGARMVAVQYRAVPLACSPGRRIARLRRQGLLTSCEGLFSKYVLHNWPSRWPDVWLAATARGTTICGDFLAATALALALQGSGAGGLAVSGLLLAATLPLVVLAPLTGRLADRVDSRTLLVTVGLAQAVICTLLAVAEHPVLVVGPGGPARLRARGDPALPGGAAAGDGPAGRPAPGQRDQSERRLHRRARSGRRWPACWWAVRHPRTAASRCRDLPGAGGRGPAAADPRGGRRPAPPRPAERGGSPANQADPERYGDGLAAAP